MNEESFLNMLSTYHKRMEQAKHQETKDSILCQLVLSLFQFVSSQEARDKIKEILQAYNSEERMPEVPRTPARYCIRAGEHLCFAFKTYVKKMYEEMQEKHPRSKVEIYLW